MINIHANNEFKFGGKDSSIRSKEAGKEKKLYRYLLFHKDSQNLSKYSARALLTYIYKRKLILRTRIRLITPRSDQIPRHHAQKDKLSIIENLNVYIS